MGDEEVLDDLSPSAEVAVDMETSHLYEPTCTTATTTTTTSTAAAASHYCQRITVQQYLQEASEYTRHVVRELEQSEDYKIHTQKCHSCSASWYLGYWSDFCTECDGHAINRPCPICNGACNQVWTRDLDMSHHNHRGHWDGECGLTEDKKQIHYYRLFVDLSDETSLCDALDEVVHITDQK